MRHRGIPTTALNGDPTRQISNRLPVVRSVMAAVLLAPALSPQEVNTEPNVIEQSSVESDDNQKVNPADFPECTDDFAHLDTGGQDNIDMSLNYAPGPALFSLLGDEAQILVAHDLTPREQLDVLNGIHAERGYQLYMAHSMQVALGSAADSLEYGPGGPRGAQRHANFSLAMEHLHHILYEYPDDLLITLGIQGVEISHDSSEPKIRGRYYSPRSNSNPFGKIEISLYTIVNESRFDYYNSENAIRQVIAHEIGHAIHDQYCHLPGSYHNDPLFADGVPFENTEPDRVNVALAEESAGENRLYVEDYSTTNVAEHFATIMAYTLSERGIIRPGDNDYGSPLQRAQKVALERAESVYPGFRGVAEQASQLIDEHGLPVMNETLDEIASSNHIPATGRSNLLQTLLAD